jgi:DNA-binding transcriptional LysR family regulator
LKSIPASLNLSDSAWIHLATCKAGAGVAILPSRVADRDSGLMCPLRPEQVFSLDLLLVVHRDLARAARIRAVMDFWPIFRQSAFEPPPLSRRRVTP